jgi:poly(3-hydroxybutyrate) depolymerase
MPRRGPFALIAVATLVGCAGADSAAPERVVPTAAATTTATVPTTAVSIAATTTTELDLQALPGHHVGPIPDAQTVLCPKARDVPIIGDPMVLPGFENRPTVLQRTADPAAPLLVIFHGQHGCIQNMQSRSDLDQIGAAAGVNIMWLSGAPVPTRSWRVNSGCCEPASDRGIDDLPYVRAAVAAARAAGLTSATVLAIGVSNGGGMAVTAGCRLPELFTGVVVVAGWAPVPCHAAAQSLLVFGGSLDTKLGSAQAARTANMWRRDVTSCPNEPVVETVGRRTTTTWSGCANGTVVRLVQLEGVPHVWPKFDFYDMDDDIIRFALGEYAAA